MSSYRSTYVPWKTSLRSTSNKTADDKDASSPNSSRYGSGTTNSYRSPISNSYLPLSSSQLSPSSYQNSKYSNSVSSLRKKYSSLSQSNAKNDTKSIIEPKKEINKPFTSSNITTKGKTASENFSSRFNSNQNGKFGNTEKSQSTKPQKITIVTRSTSPTPAPNSIFLRNRRADLEKIFKSEVDKKCSNNVTEASTQTDGENDLLKKEITRVSNNLGPKFSPNSSSSNNSNCRTTYRNSPIPRAVQNSGFSSRNQNSTTAAEVRNSKKSPILENANKISNNIINPSLKICNDSRSPIKSNESNDDSFLPINNKRHATPNTNLNLIKPRAIYSVTPNSPIIDKNNLDINLNASLSKLKLNKNENDIDINNYSDTESESSYDENYPTNNTIDNKKIKNPDPPIVEDQESKLIKKFDVPSKCRIKEVVGIETSNLDSNKCHLITNNSGNRLNSDISDKPPKYPLSPKLKHKSFKDTFSNDAKLLNIRSLSTSSANSSSEDISEVSDSSNSKNIPKTILPNNFDQNELVDIDKTIKQYPIRKMDSNDKCWWLEKESDSSLGVSNMKNNDPIRKIDSSELLWLNHNDHESNEDGSNLDFGYKVRKMDSSEILWFNQSDNELNGSDPKMELPNNKPFINSEIESHKNDISNSFGYKVRKMDSSEILWFNQSDSESNITNIQDISRLNDGSNSSTKSFGYPVRKMDSSEILWLNSNDSEYNGSDPNLYVGNNKSFINSEVESHKNDISNNNNGFGYKVRKMDSSEILWFNQSDSESKECHVPKSFPKNVEKIDSSNLNSNHIKSDDYIDTITDYRNTQYDNIDNMNDRNTQYGYKIRKMDSNDIPWWSNIEDNSNIKPNNIDNQDLNDDNLKLSNFPNSELIDTNNMDNIIPKNDAWWANLTNQDEVDNIPINRCENLAKNFNRLSIAEGRPPELLCTDNSEQLPNYKLRKFDSEEKDWWANENESGVCNNENKDSGIGVNYWDDEDSSHNDYKYVENAQYVNDYKTSKILKIEKIKPPSDEEHKICNNIQKIDLGENSFWIESEQETKEINSSCRMGNDNFFDNTNTDKNLKSNFRYLNDLDNLLLYIGEYTNIDDLLGTEVPPPAAPMTPSGDDDTSSDEIDEECKRIPACEVRIHDGSAHTSTIQRRCNFGPLDDTALQLQKDGDYGSYLDLDASISEQQEEFDGFQPRRDSIVLRTQLSVRVHMIKEKLLKSEGRELRRALFSLKQVFQEDKDLVHEFVQNDGLDCLIKVGSDVDQNYQNYILRALGQVMLYVDGMNGVMEHNATIQWLYSLVCSKFRLVIKTALKLLLVFVEYVESNCFLLIQAIHTFDITRGVLPWMNIMKLLHQLDITDIDVLIYAMTLINKTLNGLSDQDTYYDQVDLLEEQNIQSVIKWYMSKQGTNLDLLRQFQIYEAVLQYEDGEDIAYFLKQLDESIRKTLRNRKSLTCSSMTNSERRKSRRHSTGNAKTALCSTNTFKLIPQQLTSDTSADEYIIKQKAVYCDLAANGGAGVTPGLRKRRERAERHRSLLREQYENNMKSMIDTSSSNDDVPGIVNGSMNMTPRVFVPSTVNKIESQIADDHTDMHNNTNNFHNEDILSSSIRRDTSVKDITQKLVILQSPSSSTVDEPSNKIGGTSIVGEMKGIISKAMEGLAKSQSRCDMIRSPTSDSGSGSGQFSRSVEIKKSETDLHWEELLTSSTRALQLCDLDFTDLISDDERDVLAPPSNINGIPPPPPPCGIPPPVFTILKQIKKEKKTVKLFWKEVRNDPIVMTKLNSKSLIWDEINPVDVDTQKLEHLFESRAKDLITKKQHELNKNKEIIVLDPKRSNAINIGMTKLPPPRSIKTAILKMDATVMNKEGIEKLLTMLPTEEERNKIQEAQSLNPELPLGSAEHFLLTLSSISELTARLKLWSFKINYENCEKEIVEPLMDLKQGIEILNENKTFRAILSTLLSIGIFLNGSEVKGFQIEYLAKVPEVKDTVHKHSLLHHLCHIVMEKFPESTDLYSEIGAVTRASRIDFEELSNNVQRIEHECKASFDHLKAIAKHDGNTTIKLKISDFLADCAERIIALKKIHRRVINRFYKFCLWLGIPLHRIQLVKPNELCRIVSEFALEYRTTRERVIQQLEKKASHRERNKTRGKMITEVGKFRSQEDKKDAELRQLLGRNNNVENGDNTNNGLSHIQGGSLPWRRQRKEIARNMREQNINGHLGGDAGDELLESLVKSATQAPATRTAPRERKRTRHTERKSLIPKRSRTRDNLFHRSPSGSIS